MNFLFKLWPDNHGSKCYNSFYPRFNYWKKKNPTQYKVIHNFRIYKQGISIGWGKGPDADAN